MTLGAAVIIGAGSGLSASLVRQLAARSKYKLEGRAAETGAKTVEVDGSDPAAMGALFSGIDGRIGVAIDNPSARMCGPVAELDLEDLLRVVKVTAFVSFLLGRVRILAQNPVNGARGIILFTGASAGVKRFPMSASFAMGKFAQRGLAESMARDMHPQGGHVAWVNIDGGISKTARSGRTDDGSDNMLDPDAITNAYLGPMDQHRSIWLNEIALRPCIERF